MTSPARWIDHRVADADVLARDLVLVVQRGIRTTTPPTVTGSSLATGRQRAGAPDLDLDPRRTVVACSAGNLWAMAQRGAARHEAEPLPGVEAVDLVDDAVDVVAELARARSSIVAVGLEHLLDVLSQSRVSGLTGKPQRRIACVDAPTGCRPGSALASPQP